MFNVHTPVWGIGGPAFLDVALPCLINNFRKCPEEIHVFTIYSSDESQHLIEASPKYQDLVSLVPVEWQPLPRGEWEVTSVVLREFQRALSEGHYVLQLTASCSFGDDCVKNMAELAAAGHNPICYPDLKMSPQGWEEVRDYIQDHGHLPNHALVSIGMKYILPAHHTVEQIGPQTWKATLKVFSIVMLPDQRVIDLFATNDTIGSGYDHVLPYYMVTLGFPYYVIPSSDIYMTADGEIFSPRMKARQGLWRPDLSQAGEKYFTRYSVIWQGEK
ncbi:MAG: hypothetical protein WC551_07990 [Patescibacteria group bacterium]